MNITPTKNISFRANKMSGKQAEYFRDKLKNSQNVDIVCHESTDRDSLNSAIAMQRYIDSLGVNSRIIISQNLKKIGVINPTFRYIQKDELKKDEQPADTVLCVDFSSKERVNGDVLGYIQKSKNILVMDHHKNPNLCNENAIELKRPIENADKQVQSSVSCYVDSSAKSATSVVYRMLEALDEPIDNAQAYSLMFGFIDDSAKRGLVICDGEEGTITPSMELIKDKNAIDVFLGLEEKLNDEQIKKIAESVDIMANLTPKEQRFSDSLYDRIQMSDNGKIAYVVIPPDDEEWRELKEEDARVSTILNRFRQSVLANDFCDEKLDNVELAIVFYEEEGNYRISIHSKNNTIKAFYDYIQQNAIANFKQNAGGHSDRAGGKIETTDKKACADWVSKIISCADFYDFYAADS